MFDSCRDLPELVDHAASDGVESLWPDGVIGDDLDSVRHRPLGRRHEVEARKLDAKDLRADPMAQLGGQLLGPDANTRRFERVAVNEGDAWPEPVSQAPPCVAWIRERRRVAADRPQAPNEQRVEVVHGATEYARPAWAQQQHWRLR
jgi:hypothetical protein